MKFLEMIQYNVYVKLSVYMTFYLELKTLVHDGYVNKAMSTFDFKFIAEFLFFDIDSFKD